MDSKEIQLVHPKDSLEGLMLKLKFQYFGRLMRRADSLEKILMLGKTEGRRTRGQQRTRWLDGISDALGMSFGEWEMVKDRELECCRLPCDKDVDPLEELNNMVFLLIILNINVC